MRMTLEEIIHDATIYGYDFGALISRKENKMDYREYIYGYSLANDKENYLEALCENKVENCDRIYIFEDKIKESLKQIESIPHTKIISGFRTVKNEKSPDTNSIYRIISLNEVIETAFVVDIQYFNDCFDEALSFFKADLEYEEAIKVMAAAGDQELLYKAESFAGVFVLEGDIPLS